MDEINLSTNETNKKSNKHAWIPIVCGVVAFIGLFFLFFNIGETVAKEELEIYSTNLSVEYNEYLGYSATITGTAKNVSGQSLSYASVEFSVYDAAGNNLGTALANINNLGNGDTWRFEAMLLDFPSTRPVSFKLAEITAW